VLGFSVTAGDIYTVAGNGTSGYTGDGGPAPSSEVAGPFDVALDGQGNLFISDQNNNRVRVVAAVTGTVLGVSVTAGDIYTVAGNGTSGYTGDGGPATSAELFGLYGIALDGSGNLYIGDLNNSRVRVVASATGTLLGVSVTANDIYTIAGNGTKDFGGDAGPALKAEVTPMATVLDGQGNLYIADQTNNRVRVVAAVTGTLFGVSVTPGNIYTVAGNGSSGFAGDGGPASSAQLAFPSSVALDSRGNLFIADTLNQRIRVVAAVTGTVLGVSVTAGKIYTVAGSGAVGYSGDNGPAVAAAFSLQWAAVSTGLAFDRQGNLYIADFNNYRIRVVAATTGTLFGVPVTTGDIYSLADQGAYGLAVDGQGNVFFSNGTQVSVLAAVTGSLLGVSVVRGGIYPVAGGNLGFSGDGGPATLAKLNIALALALDGEGNLFIADFLNNRVRMVAAIPVQMLGVTTAVGNIYTVAGNGSPGSSGDGGPATSAELSIPSAVALLP
jgi:sugar lactone lactonase YvrE